MSDMCHVPASVWQVAYVGHVPCDAASVWQIAYVGHVPCDAASVWQVAYVGHVACDAASVWQIAYVGQTSLRKCKHLFSCAPEIVPPFVLVYLLRDKITITCVIFGAPNHMGNYMMLLLIHVWKVENIHPRWAPIRVASH